MVLGMRLLQLKLCVLNSGKMRDALNKTGRPIVFSLCGWNPWYAPEGYSLGNLWRIGPDDTNWPGVLTNIDINSQLSQYARPGRLCVLPRGHRTRNPESRPISVQVVGTIHAFSLPKISRATSE